MAIYQLADDVPGIDQSAFVFENATVIGKVRLAQDVSIWPYAALRGDNELISIGVGSNIQEGAVLHTDPGCPLTVGAHVTVGHQAMLHGCTIEDGALIGIQAVILNKARIGKNCLVGAGALVTEGRVFPDNSLIVGSPAKVFRELEPDEIERMHQNTAWYVKRAQLYKEQLKRIA
jgi:carbonic anhydrase/acetyltransferase-like protein (isoleucine patch superfamily)